MNNMEALGLFMGWCNYHADDPEVSEMKFQKGISIIMNSDEDRFDDCKNVKDVLQEIDWASMEDF